MPIPVFISCDDNYAMHLCVVVASAVLNSKSDFHFVILNKGLSDKSKKNIVESARGNVVDFVQVDAKMFESFNVKLEHLSIEACFRYIIAELDYPYQKAIYLDCDTVVLSDLRELFNTDIANFYAGVVDDIIKPSYPARLKISRYFNSGALLLNLKKMRDDKICEKLFEKTRELSGESKFLDQDVLNIVFATSEKFINIKWNATAPLFRKKVSLKNVCAEEIAAAIYKPAIVHFTGPDKPWIITAGAIAHPFAPAYFYYLAQTPYADCSAALRKKVSPARQLLRYLKNHSLFFLRCHFFKMRFLYLRNKKIYRV